MRAVHKRDWDDDRAIPLRTPRWYRLHQPWSGDTVQPDDLRWQGVGQNNHNGPWINLNCATITQIDENRFYGATAQAGFVESTCSLGSSPQVVEELVALPDHTVTTGTNSIWFRFNGTDGNTSGFRILAFNILEAAQQVNSVWVTSNVATYTTNAEA